MDGDNKPSKMLRPLALKCFSSMGVNALSANPAGLFLNKHYNKRLQNYDVRLGTNGGDEWSWNRGALRLFYNSDHGLGAQASCLPFVSGARQTTVAETYPEDQVLRSPRDASGVSRARAASRMLALPVLHAFAANRMACTPRTNAANNHFTVLASVEIV